MTISYAGHHVARLLVRWKGSVWKSTWKELVCFLILYYVVRLVYRTALNIDQKIAFEKVILEFDEFTKRIPLTFLLGFYVAAVVKRWWEQFEHIAWPDDVLLALDLVMPVPEKSLPAVDREKSLPVVGDEEKSLPVGDGEESLPIGDEKSLPVGDEEQPLPVGDEKSLPVGQEKSLPVGHGKKSSLLVGEENSLPVGGERKSLPVHGEKASSSSSSAQFTAADQIVLRRKAIARYVNLTLALAWREISVKVRRRFPRVQDLVEFGLMTPHELIVYEKCEVSVKWYVPLLWASRLLTRHLYQQQHPIPAPLLALFHSNLQTLKNHCHALHCYDWVCIPLVYTHVAALATYGYFAFCLIGRQFVENRPNLNTASVDYYVPILSVLEFLFYVGWFKVGQDLIRPFGGDDDDFELNYILDRNVHVSKFMVNNAWQDYSCCCCCCKEDGSKVALPIDNRVSSTEFWDEIVDDDEVPHGRVSSQLKNRPPKMHVHYDDTAATTTTRSTTLFKKSIFNESERFLHVSDARSAKWRYF